MLNWRKLTPVYVPMLSSATLLAQGELFHLGNGKLRADDHLAPHWHDTYELGFFRKGHGILVLGNREYTYAPGQVYIINDLEPHMAYSVDPHSTLFVVHFHPALLENSWIGQVRSEALMPFSPDFNSNGPLIPIDDPVTKPVRRILEKIHLEATQHDAAWEVIVTGLIVQAVGHLARRLLKQSGNILADPRRRQALKQIQPILELIEDQFAEPLSLDDMAQQAYISRSHCCALFQLALNTSPIAYRNARRLAEARRLLQQTDMTMREIGFQVGFSSVQQFNRLFLRETGTTPTKFRLQFYTSAQNIGS
ncbi:MAG: AraC family transcriptional regulator [Chloroflexi bacterium]|nr:AraC family transcriptional regulator [Chloroflexota bacterium]